MNLTLAPGVALTVNGRPALAEAAPGARLSEVLREALGALDVKVGCNAGDCGACTVLLDGKPVCACLTAAAQAEGRRVETPAGLVRDDPDGKRLARAFARHGAAQCGICTPGMTAAAVALLRAVPAPSESEVMDALGGVLCRCTGYRKIVAAVMDAGGTGEPLAEGRLGDPVARLDGAAKIAGTEAFGDDVAPTDALVVRVIRSPHPHARFAFGDLDAWRSAHPGIALVLTAADIPGRNRFGVIPPFADQPVFAEGAARFRGEAVAAVVGEAAAVAVLDLADFPIAWETLPALADPAAALAGPALHPGREANVVCAGHVACGDAEAALARADAVAEAEFCTAFVEHAYIEPEAGFARRMGDRIEVRACTQAPVMDRDDVAAIMGLAPGAVRVVPTATGGGFGAKLDLSVQPYVALAAWLTGRPARMAYTRTESMQSSTKRHPGAMRLRVGATRDGRISGFAFEGDFDTGAYASWGPTVAVRVPVHASGPYRIADYRASARAVHTHNPPAGAFRGFGVPQVAVAGETLMDELAELLGIDPLDFRLRNVLENGVPTVCGQVFVKGVGIRACLDALAPHWARARAEAEAANRAGSIRRRGAGVAAAWYGCGNTALPNPSTIKAGIAADGRIILHQGAMDIGQGANTVIAQIFAEALGVPLKALTLKSPDTDITPDAGKTSASRQTVISGNAARLAGAALRAAVLRLANAGTAARIEPGQVLRVTDGATRREIALADLPVDADGYVLTAEERYDPPTKPLDANGQGEPYAVFGYAAHVAEVEVDTALGTVRPLKFTAAHDVGRAINPQLVEGQVEGGIAQGLGMALMEEYIPGRTENLHDYLIPTFGDMPPVETIIVEEPDAHGPYGAKGLGEHVLIPTAPAILNAIRHATGARIRRLPATPERVLAAIREAG